MENMVTLANISNFIHRNCLGLNFCKEKLGRQNCQTLSRNQLTKKTHTHTHRVKKILVPVGYLQTLYKIIKAKRQYLRICDYLDNVKKYAYIFGKTMYILHNRKYRLGVVYFKDTQWLNKIDSSSLKYESLLRMFLHIMFKITYEKTAPLPPIPNNPMLTEK